MNRYVTKITNQGMRGDGEGLYGLQIFDREWEQRGLPAWLAVTNYDELTAYEVRQMTDAVAKVVSA